MQRQLGPEECIQPQTILDILRVVARNPRGKWTADELHKLTGKSIKSVHVAARALDAAGLCERRCEGAQTREVTYSLVPMTDRLGEVFPRRVATFTWGRYDIESIEQDHVIFSLARDPAKGVRAIGEYLKRFSKSLDRRFACDAHRYPARAKPYDGDDARLIIGAFARAYRNMTRSLGKPEGPLVFGEEPYRQCPEIDPHFIAMKYRLDVVAGKKKDAHPAPCWEDRLKTNSDVVLLPLNVFLDREKRGDIPCDFSLISVGGYPWSSHVLLSRQAYYYRYVETLHAVESSKEFVSRVLDVLTEAKFHVRTDAADPRRVRELPDVMTDAKWDFAGIALEAYLALPLSLQLEKAFVPALTIVDSTALLVRHAKLGGQLDTQRGSMGKQVHEILQATEHVPTLVEQACRNTFAREVAAAVPGFRGWRLPTENGSIVA